MDGDGGLNIRNWGYYESPLLKSNVGLQTPPNMEDRKPFLSGRDTTLMANINGGFNQRDCGVSSSHFQMNCMRDAWIHRDHKFDNKFLNVMLPANPYAVLPETTTAVHHQHHHFPLQMLQQPESSTDDRIVNVDEIIGESNTAPSKRRAVGKAENAPKTKKSKKANNAIKEGSSGSVHRAKAAKKVTEVIINGINMDISSIPIPICSCTGAAQQCYRWGSGGWQSACCTTGMSMYPLPMSSKRRGARIAGRKMSLGAFKKVLEKLAAEGYNFSNPIDLRSYWAKHGTNKFVTIR